jgi:hypothetical protein
MALTTVCKAPERMGSTQTGTPTSIISPLSGMKLPLASKLVIFSGSMVNFHADVMMTGLFTTDDDILDDMSRLSMMDDTIGLK